MNNEFMLVLKGGFDNWTTRAEEDKKEVMTHFMNWANQLSDSGHYKECIRPESDNRKISSNQGQISVDGPFVETKELISGIFFIKAKDMTEASDIAKGCPVLKFGGSVEAFALTDNRTE